MMELVIDSFAGGGGASTGIRMALGRDPDIAINHDPMALAMHRANHPGTRHMVQDVATVDSVSMCAGLPIGMLWMSPDCTDHSKAKGAAPRRDGERTTRGIGWAIVGWVRALPMWQRPRVVFLENVEEYVDWAPLLPNGKRCPVRKGATFKAFIAAWKALGYGRIEWRLRRAYVSGSGTIRRRLYIIMRRDGEPIVWPEPTHGNPDDPADAARIAAGEMRPWVTAADSIDFALPCPSIFETGAEILAKWGVRAKRPLAEKTEARIAKGVSRHVLKAARPYLVKVNHTGRDEARDQGIDLPLSALTGKRDDAVVAPVVTYAQQGGRSRPAAAPLHTITASRKDQNALIAPVLAGCGGRAGQSGPRPGNAPVLTQTAKADLCLVAPYLVPRYGERAGQQPRTYPADRPGPTPVPTGNEGNLTVVHISRQFGGSIGSDAGVPLGTITAGGDGKSALLASYVAQHNGGPRPGAPGHPADEPLSTVTTTGAQQTVVAAHMLTLRGSGRRSARASEPLRTESAQGTHNALVSAPLMTVYYGTDADGATVREPMRTDTAKPRFGLVDALATVPPFGPEQEGRARQVAEFLRRHGCWDGGEFVTFEVEGVTLVLVDLGMRMLNPRERYNANGFPRDYIIHYGIGESGEVVPFSLERQGHMCGNAVCPTEAAALVRANYIPREVAAPRRREDAQPSLFAEAAE